MGKSKRLAEELVENPQPIETLDPLDEPRASKTEEVTVKAIRPELLQSLLEYLDTRPHGEVSRLVNSLSQGKGPMAYDMQLTITYGN